MKKKAQQNPEQQNQQLLIPKHLENFREYATTK